MGRVDFFSGRTLRAAFWMVSRKVMGAQSEEGWRVVAGRKGATAERSPSLRAESGGCAWELMYETRRICDGKGEGGETRLEGDGTEEQCKGLAVERHRLAVACSARSIRRLS